MGNFADINKRLIIGIIFIAIVILSGHFGGANGFMALFILLMAICAYEWAKLCKLDGNWPKIYSFVFVLFILIMSQHLIIYPVLSFILPLLIIAHLVFNNIKIALTTGIVYLSVATISVFYSFNTIAKVWWHPIATIWLTVIFVDIGAYIVGRIVGGKKLAPKISPGKTVSGFLGGILIGSLIFTYLIAGYNYDFFVFLVGIILSTVAQIGDLYQSFMKRRVDVKDSGSILPGHGGMFDRLDGLIMVLAFIPFPILIYYFGA